MTILDQDDLDEPTSLRLSDRRARAILEDLLRMRCEAEAGNPPSLHDAYRAAFGCARLVEALSSCVAERLEIRVPCKEYKRLPTEEPRALIARTLELGLTILQPKALTELRFALEGANAGHIAPLLQKKGNRKRRAPDLAARAEFDLLKWIRWQHGLGRKVAEAENDVAQALGCTREAVQKWGIELKKVYGERRLRRELELAELVGGHERSGRSWAEFDPRESDDSALLHRMASGLERDFDLLIESRRRAVAKRR